MRAICFYFTQTLDSANDRNIYPRYGYLVSNHGRIQKTMSRYGRSGLSKLRHWQTYFVHWPNPMFEYNT